MLITPLNRVIAKVCGKATLRTVLIVPFVLQIVRTVGLVGYLSFRNGQQAVNDVASQLRYEISDRTAKRIRTYLTTPHLINLTHADAIRLGQLDIKIGLDWLIVVVVPEADFMEQINTNTYTTILLCIAAFIVTTGIGIITARWIIKPILRLNTAAKEIANRKWNKTAGFKRSHEVGELAESFNQMAAQLQQSFAELRSLNEALLQSDRKFRAIFNHTFQLTGILSLDGILLEANQTALSFGGLQRNDVVGKPFWECYWWMICQETQTQLQTAINRAGRGEFIHYEVDVLGANNRVVTIDFSLKPIFDENGNVELLISEGRDITEHKQAQKILADYNRILEAQVAERAAELIHTNEQLKREIADRQAAELALKQQKEVLQTIFDNIPVMLSFYNANVEVQLINKAFETTLGWSLEELREIDIMAQCYPDVGYRAKVTEFMMRAEGTWQDFQLRTRTDNILFTSWANVRLPDGSTVGIGKDITERKQAEEALRQSEERWQLVLKSINAGIWDINHRTAEVFHSARWKEILGYQEHEIENNSEEWFSRVHPDDFERVMAVRQAHLNQETPHYSAEYRLRCKDDSYKWILSRGLALWDEQGNLVRFVGSHEDITDRKGAEQAIRQSALRERAIATVVQKMRQTLDINTIFSATTCELRQVLNCDRVAIYRFNPDWSGEFVAESMADGWIPLIAEQKNNPYLKQDAVEDSNCTIKTLNIENDTVQDTYLQNTRGGAYSQGVNYRVTQDIYKAGFTPCYIKLLERFQVRAYIIVPIFCGSQLWGLLATYQNCTPRTWSESQISAVVQIGVQLGVALQQAQLLQHTQQQAVALKLALDELKRTQSQLIQTEKMSSLGRMVAGIAHEINNPVSFIYGNLAPARHYFQDLLSLIELYQQTYPHSTPEIQQLASDIDVDFLVEDWQKLINSIQVGAERICEIVLNLRNFSRLDEQELKAVDIHEGIDNTLLLLQHRLKTEDAHPEIEVIKNYGQLPLITCYASQLNQVFMNLLSNAIDALETQPSPGKITISTSLSQNPHGGASCAGIHFPHPAPSKVKSQNGTVPIPNSQFVEIRIVDNGCGMSEAVKEKIFDPFFTTKPVGSGTGLGLAISYQIIVEKHKGQISCISALGKGTEFIVKIPVNLTTCWRNNNF